MCLRVHADSEPSRWDSLAAARAYAQVLPCGLTGCERQHVVAWIENGAYRTEFFTARGAHHGRC